MKKGVKILESNWPFNWTGNPPLGKEPFPNNQPNPSLSQLHTVLSLSQVILLFVIIEADLIKSGKAGCFLSRCNDSSVFIIWSLAEQVLPCTCWYHQVTWIINSIAICISSWKIQQTRTWKSPILPVISQDKDKLKIWLLISHSVTHFRIIPNQYWKVSKNRFSVTL